MMKIDDLGIKKYFYGDYLHRHDGPVIEYPDGTAYYWILYNVMDDLSTEELMEWMMCYSHNFDESDVNYVKELIEKRSCVSN